MTALSIALVCLSTIMIQIPIPLGYMHLGNVCILLVSCYLGPVPGLLAAGLGSAMADLLTYPQWALPTLLIKSLMGLAIGLAARGNYAGKTRPARTMAASATGIVIMILGYFLAGSLLYGSFAAGAAQIPGLTFEGVLAIVLFSVLDAPLKAVHFPQLLQRMYTAE